MEIILTVALVAAILGVFFGLVKFLLWEKLSTTGVILTFVFALIVIFALAGLFPVIWGASYFGI